MNLCIGGKRFANLLTFKREVAFLRRNDANWIWSVVIVYLNIIFCCNYCLRTSAAQEEG